MNPDLTNLYSELGLAPDCSLAEFQLACRRRISELQPRGLGRTVSPEAHAELRDLIGLYKTATRFHRRFGRLPGAAPRRAFGGTPFRSGMAGMRPVEGSEASGGEAPSRLAVAISALLVLLFAALALLSGEWFR
jgi:hypothetical protein